MPISLSGSLLVTGSITTSGTITAQTLVVQTITSSIVNMTGSNIFGSQLTDRQTFTGSMYVTGSTAYFAGNVGIGVTSSAWRTTDKVIQINNGSIYDESGINFWVGQNYYENSAGAYIYLANSGASAYRQYNGQHQWFNAPSATAGAIMTFTQSMTLFANGNLAVGTTTDAGYKLDVNGTGRFSGALTGTSATFSGDVSIVESGNALLRVQASTITTPIADIELMRGTNNTWGADGYGDYRFRSSGGDLLIQYGDTGVTSTRLTIASTGAATFSSSVRVNGGELTIYNGSSIAYAGVDTGNSYVYYGTNTANYGISFQASGERMIIKSNGNVGIGTTSPSYKLDILADATSGSSNGIKVLAGTNSSDYALLVNNQANTLSRFVVRGDGLVGIGTSSPSTTLHINSAVDTTLTIDSGGTAYSSIISFVADSERAKIIGSYASGGGGQLAFHTDTAGGSDLERMRIDSSGNVGIGAASVGSKLYTYLSGDGTHYRGRTIDGSNNPYIDIKTSGGTVFLDANGSAYGQMAFKCGDVERMRITSGGTMLLGVTGSLGGYDGHFIVKDSTAYALLIRNSNTGNVSAAQFSLAGDPNNASSYFWIARGGDVSTGTSRAYLKGDGGLANYQANNTNLSDIRTKTDINPIESYWDKFKNIEIVKFKYKDQTHNDYNIGVIAQQVEEVAPEFVDVDGWGETPEDGIPLKTIYTSDLHHATIKVLQEAMAKIEELTAKVTALENK